MGPTSPPTPVPTPAPCPPGEKFLKVTILTDNYPEETTWTVKNTCTGDLVMSGGPYDTSGTTYESQKCLPEGEGDTAYEFNILVSSDDDHFLARLHKPFYNTRLNIFVIGHIRHNFRTFGATVCAVSTAVAATESNMGLRYLHRVISLVPPKQGSCMVVHVTQHFHQVKLPHLSQRSDQRTLTAFLQLLIS